jgi:hypothetical protein
MGAAVGGRAAGVCPGGDQEVAGVARVGEAANPVDLRAAARGAGTYCSQVFRAQVGEPRDMQAIGVTGQTVRGVGRKAGQLKKLRTEARKLVQRVAEGLPTDGARVRAAGGGGP